MRAVGKLDQFAKETLAREIPSVTHGWLLRMVGLLPMTAAVYDEVLRFVTTKTDDPQMRDRQLRMVRAFVDTTPEVSAELVGRGERAALRRVLARRGLALSPEQEAQIDACTDLDTLLRWVDQAVVAESTAEALR